MTHHVHIVILAAGKGSRMHSNLPKPMHCIGNRPMISHVVDTALKLNPNSLSVVVAPNDQQIPMHISGATPVVQPVPKGTGDAVRCALTDLKDAVGSLLVLFGDAPLIKADTLNGLLTHHHSKDQCITVLAFDKEKPGSYGRLVTDDSDIVTQIVEAKDASPDELSITLCNSGIMIIDLAHAQHLIDSLTDNNAAREIYLTDLISSATRRGLDCGFVIGGEEETLGANDRVELSEMELIYQGRKRKAAMRSGATLMDPNSVTFSWDTILDPDTIIEPNVFFGPGVHVKAGSRIRAFSHLEKSVVCEKAVIGPYARLRPGTHIGRDARVGNFVEIKNSQVEDGAKISHLSYIGDADIGARANIGAGTITCNYDGFNKHRTEIGADAFIGSNTSLVAPVQVGAQAVVGAGSTITDNVPAKALTLVRGEKFQKPMGGIAYRNRNSAISKTA